MSATGEDARKAILRRRSTAIADRSQVGIDKGTLDLAQAVAGGVLVENCLHQVGIATATEVRLSVERYPIRVVVGTPPPATDPEVIAVSASYWRITNATLQLVPFARLAPVNEQALERLYLLVPDLDAIWWTFRRQHAAAVSAIIPAQATIVTAVHDYLQVPNPTADQTAAAKTNFDALMVAFSAANTIPYIRIGEASYIVAAPVGQAYAQVGTLTAAQCTALELFATALVNFNQMSGRYATLPVGTRNQAAWCVAVMSRMGFMEYYEHKEFVTVYATPVVNQPAQLTVNAVSAPANYTTPALIAVNAVIDVSTVRADDAIIQLASSLIVGSGNMHYMFNHTTGGSQVTGMLQSILLMNKYLNAGSASAEIDAITSLMYETLHPVNKRAVANILFDNCKVFTHGKSSHARAYTEMQLDPFMSIRKKPYPAGTHKAFVALVGLRRILTSGLAPFLPWAAELPTLTHACIDILSAGARGHIGASYYTGRSPQTQSSMMDTYLPEIASYVHTFHRTDSLAASPHLSAEVAARADANWANLVKMVKGKDISTTAPDKVRAFLATHGKDTFQMDMEKPETWPAALQTTKEALKAVNDAFAAT